MKRLNTLQYFIWMFNTSKTSDYLLMVLMAFLDGYS